MVALLDTGMAGTSGFRSLERCFCTEFAGGRLTDYLSDTMKCNSDAHSHFVFMIRADGGMQEPQAAADAAHKLYPLLLSRRAILSRKSTTYFMGHAADATSKEVWRRRRLCWLCKELPVRTGRAFFRMLKEQRKWMGLTDAHKVMEELMRRRELNCCYNVFKWTLEQPWYEFDYGLTTRMANLLGLDRKAGKARELLDVLIASGKPPDASTFASVTVACINEGQEDSIMTAWTVYNQMIMVGGYDPPLTIQNKLFAALARVAEDAPECGDHADVIFHRIKNAGNTCSVDMHVSLMWIYARSGDRKKMDSLVRTMQRCRMSFGLEGFTAMMHLCLKEGNVQNAEKTWLDIVKACYLPDGRVYLYAMKIYRVAGMPKQAHQKFMEMLNKGIQPGCKAYLVVIQSMAEAGQETRALEFLDRLRHTGLTPLLPAYNAIMDMYLRLKAYDKVRSMFEQMQTESCRPNRDSYQMLIESFLQAGLLEQAEELFEYMLETYQPNHKTRNLMMAAYRRQGNLDKANVIKMSMDRHGRVAAENVLSSTLTSSGRPPFDLTLDTAQKEALVGLLLGGAYMGSDDNGLTYSVNCQFDPTSSHARSLLRNLTSLFSQWILQAPSNAAAPNSDLLALSTISHPSLRFFASRYRPLGDPVIPRLVRFWLTPRALAYWYMYGSCRCGMTEDILLYANVYSSEEVVLVSHALRDLGINCRRHYDGSIHLGEISTQLAWKLMEPHILVDLKDSLRPGTTK